MSRRPVLLWLATLLVWLGPAAPVHGGSGHDWPVRPAVVTRHFVLPAHDWLPGHRGVDLAASHGDEVRATAAGIVTFAGSVVGVRWVTIDHGDGLRTTVGPLRDLAVAKGGVVRGGDVVGLAEASESHDGVHWSARVDGQYVDPRGLLGVLVPRLVGPGGWEPAHVHDLPGYEPWDGRDLRWGLLPGTQPAVDPGWLSPPNGNHVVGVAGLLTHSGSTPLPLDLLGFELGDTTLLSHAGRRVRDAVDDLDPARDQLPYGASDTFAGVDASARLLEAQLRAQWLREPGVGIDLVGHSFGGVVILHYLLAIHDPADPGLPPIDHVVTLASPLEGADLANAAVDLAGNLLGLLDVPQTVADLEVGSDLLRELARSWSRAQADPHRSPLATGTEVLTIGGSRDVVVPEHRSDLPGADHVTVPGGHTAMHESEAVLQVVRAFLAGETVPAQAGGWGAWLSGGISLAEQLVGVAL